MIAMGTGSLCPWGVFCIAVLAVVSGLQRSNAGGTNQYTWLLPWLVLLKGYGVPSSQLGPPIGCFLFLPTFPCMSGRTSLLYLKSFLEVAAPGCLPRRGLGRAKRPGKLF